MTTARDIELARARFSYLLRALWRKIDWMALTDSRKRDLQREAKDALWPIAIASRSSLEMVRMFADRFEVRISGSEQYKPPAAWIPEAFLEPGATTYHHERMPDGYVGVRWDVLTRQIDFEALRHVVHENPALLVTFATTDQVDGEEACFPIPAAGADGGHYAAPLPTRLISPRAFRTTWTLTSNAHHGSDEKSGNVSTFRRHKMIDPRTGKVSLVPFFSGNSIRGQWRDRLFFRMLGILGLSATQLPPSRAHALLAGGSIDSGADGAKTDTDARRRARTMCPGWDLVAGCIDQQIMEGRLHVHDGVIVCRESAWILYQHLEPTLADGAPMPFEAFERALKPADDLTQLRLGTRNAHRDLEGSDGSQMIFNVEGLLIGSQVVHSLHVKSLPTASETTLSCLADLLSDFRDDAYIGAKNNGGYGQIAFDPYRALDFELPTSEPYHRFLEERAGDIKAWLMNESATPLDGEDKPAAKGKRTKKSAADVIAEVQAQDAASPQAGLF